MNGIPDCDNDTPTSADKGYYEEIYSPAAVTNLTGSSSVAGRANLNWNTTNVHVEKDFEIQRCTGRKTVCDAASASWTENVATAVTNAHVIRLTEQGSGWRTSCTVTVGREKGPVTTVNVRANFAVRSCRLRLLVGSGVGSFTTSSGGRTVHSGARTVQCGQSISYSATAGTGYCFSRWGSASLGVSGQSSCRTTSGVQSIASFAADFTFTAHFTKKRYTLRITKTAGGSVSPGAGAYTYSHGTRVTITATPFYRFQTRWGGACSGSGSTCTVTMTGPRSVSVTFSPGSSGGFGEEESGGPSGQAETPSATPSPSATPAPSPSPAAARAVDCARMETSFFEADEFSGGKGRRYLTIDSDYRWEKGDEVWLETDDGPIRLRLTWVVVRVAADGALTRELLGLRL